VKTQIIQLETHDDTISIKDKMGWSQTGRVALVWPARGQLMDRRLDLVLLKRHSQALGVQIALVTKDREVRFQASQLGIPVFRSLRKAQTQRWKRIPRKTSGPASEVSGQERLSRIEKLLENPLHRARDNRSMSQPVRIAIFGLAVAAVLSIAAVLVPSSKIYLSPESGLQEITLTVTADEAVDQINLGGILPVSWTPVTVEGRGSIPTSGTMSLPFGYATGEVLFKNLTDQVVIIPANTVVSTANSTHRFLTQKEVRIPAGPGMENTAPIKAIAPGSSSNLSTGRIVAIESDLGVLVTVNNTSPVTGGSMISSPAPNSQDRQQVREDLITSLSSNALQEMRGNLDPGDILLSDSPTLVRVVSESYTPRDLQPASELELILRLDFKIPYTAAEDVDDFARSILDANLPEGFQAVPTSMEVAQVTTPKLEDGVTKPWKIMLSRAIQSDPSPQEAASLALGHRPELASQLLMENLSISSAPRFETSPSWWPVIPFVPIRIEVIMTNNVQASIPAADGALD
jgi:hypothetical protein